MAAPQAPYIGKKTGKVALDEAVFGESLPRAARAPRGGRRANARRRGTASTLTRGEVAMTGAKAWRQKGTGRARAGALSVPHRTGGGVAFGPKPRAYTVKVNRKERRRAMRAALSVHAEPRERSPPWIPRAFSEPSTKAAAEALAGFGDGGRALVVLVDGEENAALSFRNLAGVTVLHASRRGRGRRDRRGPARGLGGGARAARQGRALRRSRRPRP